MSSGTSTDFQPWQFFVLAALAAATAVIVLARQTSPSNLILLSITIGAAALAALALHRTLWPLAVRSDDHLDRIEMIGNRTRSAMEREKGLVLRSIKELEFDRAMGKVSDDDFIEMDGRLRARAISLMKQLDRGTNAYRELIERELSARLMKQGVSPSRFATALAESSLAEQLASATPGTLPVGPAQERRVCPVCDTPNDADARFCKSCGKVPPSSL